ncbi:MAG TPA: vWA domain-containing protein [Polyangiaceae bacterium]
MLSEKGSALGLLFAALVLAQACSDENATDDTGGTSGTGGTARGGSTATGGRTSGGTAGSSATSGTAATASGGSAAGGRGGTTGSGGSSGASSGDICPGVPLEDADGGAGVEACRGVSYEAESVPVDLYLMMDRSISLAEVDEATGKTRWESLRVAIAAFIDEADDQNLRVGLGFFGRTGGNDDALDCDSSFYASPAVEIGELSDVGPDVLDALSAIQPGGFTPTGPALAGALEHASEWAANAPGRATAVVLVTDGYPTQCDPRGISAIADLAERARSNEPYVRTFVIGLAAEFNLDSIARAGGTHQAYRVEAGDPTGSFLGALRNVSNSKLACSYEIPEPPADTMKIDYDEVQVTYTSAGGSLEEVPRISDFSACSRNPNGGWYYDDPQAPTQILVCPCTCSRFEAGRVDVALGCKPSIGIR